MSLTFSFWLLVTELWQNFSLAPFEVIFTGYVPLGLVIKLLYIFLITYHLKFPLQSISTATLLVSITH